MRLINYHEVLFPTQRFQILIGKSYFEPANFDELKAGGIEPINDIYHW